ncbi:caffeoyl- O-methyltransferase [Raphidocelis subcapitata]|uniref:Caffeoyl-O-methyltransferase n=1 Tax=Raphidocelis subcapitata TaxID=307507 RepID=A0A2V0PCM2_9CHLO|nr:caffeoyl- O-methyltransferase [Raphidocelis subcapitata]|eukprot:GBF94855.1 caffeoyl- O-methyltransferase [Raphidocelis subcapitata]
MHGRCVGRQAAAVRALVGATAAAQRPPLPTPRCGPHAARPSTPAGVCCSAAASGRDSEFSSSGGGGGAAAAPSSSGSSFSSAPAGLERADSGPLNKQVIAGNMTDRLYTYLLAHTREPPILRRLREETAGMHGAQMQISPEQGQFMGLLTELLGVRRALEVGVFTGYSSLAVAMALPPDGRLVALDKDAKSMEVARRYWREAGVGHKVDSRLAPADESLAALLAEHGPGSFDFAFIDADKRAYPRYFEACLQLVRPGGLIAVDNVLFYGKVADEQVQDKATVALREFNSSVLSDPRVSLSIVPVGDGMALCRKR